MHLKRLELLGFKSFAQKTVLDFPGGIAGIVGPNGSGKSNVIDAVRWILGEREAKNLRGDKAEDLIFAGTHTRPRMSVGQVTLTFDNSTGFFPVDFSEVSIVRRIERDGVSRYFINKSEVRLKDIIDFFAKARLGTKGLTIINQGEGDLFVKASPAQRREMIEEILGLRQFQLKKHDAKIKLKNTCINADKVKAMVDEISPHLKFLKRQTSKWEKLSEIENQLKESENIYFSIKLKEIDQGVEKFNPRIKELDLEKSKKQGELKFLETALSKIENSQPKEKADFSENRTRRDNLLAKRSTLEKEIGRLEARLEFTAIPKHDKNIPVLLDEVKSKIKTLLEEKDFLTVQKSLRELFNKIENALNPKAGSNENNQELLAIKKSKEELLKQIDEISVELTALNREEIESSKNLQGFNEQFKHAFEALEAKKSEISRLENEKNRLLFEVERFNLRMQDLETQVRQAGRKIEEFKNIAGIGNELMTEDLSALERKIFKLRAEIAGIGEIDQALLNEAKETETRFNFLSGQLLDLEKATKDLESMIKELDTKIHTDFAIALKKINEEFQKFFELMFGGGKAKLVMEKPIEKEEIVDAEGTGASETGINNEEGEGEKDKSLEMGIEVDLLLPRKKIRGLEMLSGGEKSLVSIAALFALISVSPPPFLVLDEIDAALDERNTQRFADLIKNFSKNTQFIIVTHNRATMESADVLYGVTMEEAGVSKVLSLNMVA